RRVTAHEVLGEAALSRIEGPGRPPNRGSRAASWGDGPRPPGIAVDLHNFRRRERTEKGVLCRLQVEVVPGDGVPAPREVTQVVIALIFLEVLERVIEPLEQQAVVIGILEV